MSLVNTASLVHYGNVSAPDLADSIESGSIPEIATESFSFQHDRLGEVAVQFRTSDGGLHRIDTDHGRMSFTSTPATESSPAVIIGSVFIAGNVCKFVVKLRDGTVELHEVPTES